MNNDNKTNIVIIDENSNILRSIKRILKNQNVNWQFFFAASKAEFLILHEEIEIDVLVLATGKNSREIYNEVSPSYEDGLGYFFDLELPYEDRYCSEGFTVVHFPLPFSFASLLTQIQNALSLRDYAKCNYAKQLVTRDSYALKLSPFYRRVIRLLNQPKGLEQQIYNLIKEMPWLSKKVSLLSKMSPIVNQQGLEIKNAEIRYRNYSPPLSEQSICATDFLMGHSDHQRLLNIIFAAAIVDMLSNEEIPDEIGEYYFAKMISDMDAVLLFSREAKQLAVETKLACYSSALIHFGDMLLYHYDKPKHNLLLAFASEKKQPAYRNQYQLLGTSSYLLSLYVLGLWWAPLDICLTLLSQLEREKFYQFNRQSVLLLQSVSASQPYFGARNNIV